MTKITIKTIRKLNIPSPLLYFPTHNFYISNHSDRYVPIVCDKVIVRPDNSEV